MVKFAFIGCGGRSGAHLPNISKFSDTKIVGFFDIVTSRAVEKCEKYGCDQSCVYESLTEMLDTAKPDAVVIAVPPNAHGEIEREVIARGIDFLVEKPMEMTLEAATAICDAAEAKNLITCVGFQDRYLDIIETTRRFAEGRKLGLVMGGWVGGIPGVAWWPHYSTSCGQIVEQNIHHFDLLRYLVGEPASVYCAGGKGIVTKKDYDLHDYSSATIKFKNGVVGNIVTACYIEGATPSYPTGLQFYFADATVEYYIRNHINIRTAEYSRTQDRIMDNTESLDRAFVDAVKAHDQSLVKSSYRDALKSLRFTIACNESILSGKEIEL